MKRRRFFAALLAGTVWPLATKSYAAIPTIGYLANASADEFAQLVDAFRSGLAETGHIEGRNVAIEFRSSDGRTEKLRDLASDLVRRQVAVIVATGGRAPAIAAKAETKTIPIVFTGGGDPVAAGLVASLGRPGGNATGVIRTASATLDPWARFAHAGRHSTPPGDRRQCSPARATRKVKARRRFLHRFGYASGLPVHFNELSAVACAVLGHARGGTKT